MDLWKALIKEDNMEYLVEYLNKGILAMLTISMPCICTAAAIGLIIGILQAVTQVQEQTIAAAPKVIGVFLVILIGGVGFLRLLTNVFLEGANMAFYILPKQGTYALSEDYFKYTKATFNREMKESAKTSGFTETIKQSSGNVPYLNNNSKKFVKYSTNRDAVPKPDFLENKTIRGN